MSAGVERSEGVRLGGLRAHGARGEALASVLEAALRAADPTRAIQSMCAVDDAHITIDGTSYPRGELGRVRALAIGKAAARMAVALERALGDALTDGLAVTRHGHREPTRVIEVIEAAHPVPDARSVAAGVRVEAFARSCRPDDLVLVMLSGGGSALLCAPVEGLSLEALQRASEALLGSGAPIEVINQVRKRLDRLKGGGLAGAFGAAQVHALILSDVVPAPGMTRAEALASVASGPLHADETSPRAVRALLHEHGLNQALDEELLALVRAASPVHVPAPRVSCLGDNALAVEAAREAAEAQGWVVEVAHGVTGEAWRLGARYGGAVLAALMEGDTSSRPRCWIWGGESTVTLDRRAGRVGRGGRNQEAAASMALTCDVTAPMFLVKHHADLLFAALGTDGADGPTDAAGAWWSLRAVVSWPEALTDAVEQHDAYPLFDAHDALLRTGPTGTNVNDLHVAVFFPG